MGNLFSKNEEVPFSDLPEIPPEPEPPLIMIATVASTKSGASFRTIRSKSFGVWEKTIPVKLRKKIKVFIETKKRGFWREGVRLLHEFLLV